MRFAENPKDTTVCDNGAILIRTPGHFSTLAKVKNCPIKGTNLRLTVRATNYADTFFSIPATTTYKKKHIAGYLTHHHDEGIVFIAYEYGKNFRLLK